MTLMIRSRPETAAVLITYCRTPGPRGRVSLSHGRSVAGETEEPGLSLFVDEPFAFGRG